MLSKDREANLRSFGRLLHGAGALCVLLILLTYHVTVRRSFDRRQSEHLARITELQGLMKNKVIVRGEHERLNEALAELEALAGQVEARIPQEPQEGDFLRQISEAAHAEAMQIRDYQRGARFERESHSELEVQFACNGDYQSICRFLDRLDKLSRVATIQQLTLRSSASQSTYPVQFNLLLYFGMKKQAEEVKSG